KHLGTNGGGFFGANSATPFENPTVISNIVEMISMMILPGACVVTFGKMLHRRKKEEKTPWIGKQGKVIFAAMAVIFLLGLSLCYQAELAGNPTLAKAGLNQTAGSMEGKEVRFGIAQSTLFTTVTTSFTTGTVNNMHDTLTPLGGLVPMLHMMLNCVFGGKGVGLMNMIMYAILAVFLCGLMIGRTPEYLGKKIEGKEMKLVALVLIIHPLLILGFSALAVSTGSGLAGISNPGFHGLSQVLYEYASSSANNGSGFEGLADNTVFWNVTAGLAMFFGRYITMIAQLAIAGSLLAKKRMNESIGTLRTDNVIFTITLIAVVYIFAALTFSPALALGPIAEHLTLWY
ncbi:MAG: potassium-transporting ATPase subunit KdpA, partial [Lachnospiraceae bacterium]